MQITDGLKGQASDLAYLINLAGESIPEYLWRGMVEGDETPFDVGTRRAGARRCRRADTNKGGHDHEPDRMFGKRRGETAL